MSVTEVFVGGRVRQRWDTNRKVHETLDGNGLVISTRPLTADEIPDAEPVEPQLPQVTARAAKAAELAVTSAAADLSAALDPDVPNPSTTARLAALEATVALLIGRLDS